MEFKLGKQPYQYDSRTLALGNFLKVPYYSEHFDFDKYRAKFPVHVWGNNDYGDCVLAAEANCMLRLERVETRRTLATLTDQVVINRYKHLTGCENPGDRNDNGLVMLNAFRAWRHTGWNFGPERVYTIEAFGELDPLDNEQLRAAIFLLGGIHLGFDLPRTAAKQTEQGCWDIVDDGVNSKPGSWGGHAVYAKRYDKNNIYVMTWGREVRVTNAFFAKYCDEAWGVVDSLDKWRRTNFLDVDSMLVKMRSVGIQVKG